MRDTEELNDMSTSKSLYLRKSCRSIYLDNFNKKNFCTRKNNFISKINSFIKGKINSNSNSNYKDDNNYSTNKDISASRNNNTSYLLSNISDYINTNNSSIGNINYNILNSLIEELMNFILLCNKITDIEDMLKENKHIIVIKLLSLLIKNNQQDSINTANTMNKLVSDENIKQDENNMNFINSINIWNNGSNSNSSNTRVKTLEDTILVTLKTLYLIYMYNNQLSIVKIEEDFFDNSTHKILAFLIKNTTDNNIHLLCYYLINELISENEDFREVFIHELSLVLLIKLSMKLYINASYNNNEDLKFILSRFEVKKLFFKGNNISHFNNFTSPQYNDNSHDLIFGMNSDNNSENDEFIIQILICFYNICFSNKIEKIISSNKQDFNELMQTLIYLLVKKDNENVFQMTLCVLLALLETKNTMFLFQVSLANITLEEVLFNYLDRYLKKRRELKDNELIVYEKYLQPILNLVIKNLKYMEIIKNINRNNLGFVNNYSNTNTTNTTNTSSIFNSYSDNYEGKLSFLTEFCLNYLETTYIMVKNDMKSSNKNSNSIININNISGVNNKTMNDSCSITKYQEKSSNIDYKNKLKLLKLILDLINEIVKKSTSITDRILYSSNSTSQAINLNIDNNNSSENGNSNSSLETNIKIAQHTSIIEILEFFISNTIIFSSIKEYSIKLYYNLIYQSNKEKEFYFDILEQRKSHVGELKTNKFQLITIMIDSLKIIQVCVEKLKKKNSLLVSDLLINEFKELQGNGVNTEIEYRNIFDIECKKIIKYLKNNK